MTIKTSTKYNFDKAENDIFSWTQWDGTSGDMLKHKASGRYIYQMSWLNEKGKMAETVEGEIRDAAKAFWAELRVLQDQKPPMTEDDYAEEEHGFGWCNKCHFYCYGDCTAN